MIRVTVWYEYAQERGILKPEFAEGMPEEMIEKFSSWLPQAAERICSQYPDGVMGTLAAYLEKNPDFQVTYVNMYMPQYGLPDELLDNTDVLIYWAHIMHQAIPDSLAFKIVKRVQAGMGFIPLHSAHQSKPFTYLMGTSGSLSWREGDFCRLWTVAPAHPIAQGIPESVELSEEEMYGEPFDIPTPEETIFISWYSGGEVFRSGCTWRRGYGKIFYFQPGHETNPSYHNPYVLKIIENAVYWAAPTVWREDFSCPNILESPEKKRAERG